MQRQHSEVRFLLACSMLPPAAGNVYREMHKISESNIIAIEAFCSSFFAPHLNWVEVSGDSGFISSNCSVIV